MADKDVIAIKFGVAGEGNINGESGQLIQRQLNEIASNVKVQIKVNVDANHFKQQLQQLANSAISASGGAGSGTLGKGTGAVKDINKQSEEYKKLIFLLGEYRKQVNKVNSSVSTSSNSYAENKRRIEELRNQLLQRAAAFATDHKNATQEMSTLVALAEQYRDVAAAIESETAAKQEDKINQAKNNSSNLFAKSSGIGERYSSLIKSNKKAEESYNLLLQAKQKYDEALQSGDYSKVEQAGIVFKKQLGETQEKMSELAKEDDNLLSKFKETFSSKLIQKFALAIMAFVGAALKKIYENVVKIDNAMGQLRIVANATRKEYEKFSKQIAQSAQAIGASMEDLIKSTTTYARLGYALEDAGKLATLTTSYSKVADVGIDDATSNITAILKAFSIEADGLESVIDQLIYVGNNYAISSSELGEGMNNAASALAANGNTLTEAMGILTAAQVTIQNASRSSTAVRTIAARISQSTTELEDLGEDSSDVLTTAKLDEKMRAFGVAVTDANGNLRSTYNILSDLSKIWNTLNNTEQAAIANMLSGTRQQNAFYSIMQNWQDAEKIVDNVSKSNGALETAQKKYLDTIEGRSEQLKAAWEEFSRTVLDSDFIKEIISLLTDLAGALTAITSWADGIIPKLLGALTIFTTIKGLLSITKIKNFFTTIDKIIGRFFTNFKEVMKSFGAALKNGLQEIGKAFKESFAQNGWLLFITAFLFLLQNLNKKWGRTVAIVVSGLFLLGVAVWAFVLIAKGGLEALKTAIMNVPILGWIAAIITAIVTLGLAIAKFVEAANAKQQELKEKAEETAKKLQEEADAVKELSDSFKEACDSADQLIDKFKELGNSANASDWHDTLMGLGENIAALYPNDTLSSLEAINKLLGSSYSYGELMALNDAKRLELLNSIQTAMANENKLKAEESYKSQKGATAEASRASGIQSITYGKGENDEWQKADGKAGKWTVAKLNKEAEELFWSIGVSAERKYVAKDATYTQLDFTIDEGSAKANLDKVNEALNKYEEKYAEKLDELKGNAIYQTLQKMKAENEEAIRLQQNGADTLLTESIRSIANSVNINETVEDVTKEYQRAISEFKEYLSNDDSIKEAIADGYLSETNYDQYINSYIAKNYTEFYNKAIDYVERVNISLKSTSDILDDLKDGYDALGDALSSFNDIGTVTADNYEKLVELGLEEYVTLNKTTGLYEIAADVQKKYFEDKMQAYQDDIKAAKNYYVKLATEYRRKYGTDEGANIDERRQVEAAKNSLENAAKNAENLLIEVGLIERENLLEEYQDLLDKQKDLFEEMLKQQEEFADVRKDILKTYQEELDYQKQLAKKQNTVSMLKTQLALASLDTSEAGKARSRSIQADLEEAEEELNEFTLENAIDRIQNSLDEEISEYKQFIDKELSAIEEAIKTADSQSNVELSQNIATLSEKLSGTTEGVGSAISGLGETLSSALESQEAEDLNIAITLANTTVENNGIKNPNVLPGEKNNSPRNSIERNHAMHGISPLRERAIDVTLMYHSGGWVGDLESNEEFAKLLKGEFVATPKMIENFMGNVLPNIVSSSPVGEIVVNSPLVQIDCENVNDNTLPQLEALAKRAAQLVEKGMTDALTRTGYKKTY